MFLYLVPTDNSSFLLLLALDLALRWHPSAASLGPKIVASDCKAATDGFSHYLFARLVPAVQHVRAGLYARRSCAPTRYLPLAPPIPTTPAPYALYTRSIAVTCVLLTRRPRAWSPPHVHSFRATLCSIFAAPLSRLAPDTRSICVQSPLLMRSLPVASVLDICPVCACCPLLPCLVTAPCALSAHFPPWSSNYVCSTVSPPHSLPAVRTLQ
ncbi:hypothetical protein B0H14DRAFT_3516379 [Mycena olivaceomarginata]|nr:hypothetical protein B0H14DRAFT_3516379 [Mycena olivaceomarginata]